MKQVQAQLDALVKGRVASGLDVREIERLAQVATKVQKAFISAGLDKSKALDSFDESFSQLMHSYEVTQKEYAAAIASGNKEAAELQQQQLQNIQKGLQGMVDVADAKMDLTPSSRNMAKAGIALSDGFVSSLEKIKSGDLAGMSKAFFGGGAKAALKASKIQGGKAAVAGAAGDVGGAEALASSAKMLGTVAVALGGVAVAVGVVVALLVGADDRQKELNKTLLEGAGIGDWAFGSMAENAQALDGTLQKVRDAARGVAYEFGGDAKDYAALFASLQAGGFTLKELTANGRDLRMTLANLIRDANAVGVSMGEAAQTYAEFNETFGYNQDQIHERFLEIAKAAAGSSMGTKRFFTAVSQATSGMALYNVRMEEAAELLAVTSKILGSTDASDFIKSLTKGFVDESYTDRFSRLVREGSDAAKNIASSLTHAYEEFSRNFGANPAVRSAFAGALGAAVANIDLADPKQLGKALEGATVDQMSALRAALLQQKGSPEADAALRSIQVIGDLQRGMSGHISDMAVSLDGLDMRAKLAAKMDNAFGFRLDKASGLQLAAIENSEGLSGEQLLQMRRVSESLYDLYKAEVGADAAAQGGQSAFLDWVRTSDAATSIANQAMSDNTLAAADYSKSIAEHTVTMSDRMGLIYDLLLQTLEPMAEGMSKLVTTLSGGAIGMLGGWGSSSSSGPSPAQIKAQQVHVQAQDDMASTSTDLGNLEWKMQQWKSGGMKEDHPEYQKAMAEQQRLLKKLDQLKQIKDDADKALKSRPADVETGTYDALQRSARESLAGKLAEATGADYMSTLGALKSGIIPANVRDALNNDPAMKAQALQLGLDPMAHDFVSRPGQAAQRFSSNDTLVGLKSGGPLDNALKGGGGSVTININGGDMSQVYRTVRSAIKTSKG
jgi:hypothetical protein